MEAVNTNCVSILAARSRFPFKMDFGGAECIARLRSGVKSRFSYCQVAWEVKRKMEALEPALGHLMDATPRGWRTR